MAPIAIRGPSDAQWGASMVTPRPVSLTDGQLQFVQNAAASLPVRHREAFSQNVNQASCRRAV